MEIKRAIALRKSSRAYQSAQLSEEDLTTILTAGCAAPVGMGQYDALHITAIQGAELLERLSSAASKVMGQKEPFYGAPTVLLLSAKESIDPGISYVNAACMMENMLLAGAGIGVGSVIVWSTALAVRAKPDLSAELCM